MLKMRNNFRCKKDNFGLDFGGPHAYCHVSRTFVVLSSDLLDSLPFCSNIFVGMFMVTGNPLPKAVKSCAAASVWQGEPKKCRQPV
jgi:hypothetical protein